MKRVACAALAASLLIAAAAAAAEKHPFGIDDMLRMQRISDPQPSPDGRSVLFTAGLPDLKANKVAKDLWIVSAAGDRAPRRLTKGDGPSFGARWSPDGKRAAFIGVRKGKAQIHLLDPASGSARAIPLPVDVDNVLFMPDGRTLLFTAEVYPDCPDLACTVKRDAQKEGDPVSVRAYEHLLFRHWDTWEDGKRSHLFLLPEGGKPVDLTAGLDADVPTKPWGGLEEIAVAPDGAEIVYAVRNSPNPAWSTNVDLFAVDAKTRERRCLTCENQATDTAPAFSPDGKQLAYLAMARPGYESDRFRIIVIDLATGAKRVLTGKWDRSPEAIIWSEDGKTIFAPATENARRRIFAIDAATGAVRTVVADHFNDGISVAGGRLFFTQDSFTAPAEVMNCALDGSGCAWLTRMNEAALADVIMSEPEEFRFKGAGGDEVQGWFFKPVGWREGASYPLAVFIHGGPQLPWEDHFHYRWNMMIAPGRGYAAATVNFHGSTGFGQKFTDSIHNDWRGKPYRDIMASVDRVLADHAWIDADRACVLGASFGGYMVNWINGHTDRFACLIAHDGNFTTSPFYYSTEELWFPEWDMEGTAFDKPANYERWSPHRFVKEWKTPTLVVQGAKDFRIVDTEGLATFTALKRRGVPARLLYFPDENHWVLKPANSKRWHEEVYGWMDRWTKKP